METVFWIIVILAIAAVVVFFIREKRQEAEHHRSFREKFPVLNPSQRDRADAESPEEQFEPLVMDTDEHFDDLPTLQTDHPTQNQTNVLSKEQVQENDTDQRDDMPDTKVIILHIMPHKQLRFSGGEILQSMQSCGLEYGKQKIFRYPPQNQQGGEPLFSVANVMEPGYFELDDMEERKFNGLVIFMQLKNSLAALTSFDIMLDKAIRIAKALEGELQDDRRCKLSKQTLGHMRNELEEFQRKAQLEAARRRA